MALMIRNETNTKEVCLKEHTDVCKYVCLVCVAGLPGLVVPQCLRSVVCVAEGVRGADVD